MILIGKIIGPHGIKGTIKVKPYTDFLERFDKGKIIKIKFQNELFEFLIEGSSLHKNFVLIKLKDIDNMDAALNLKNCDIVIDENELKKLEKDEYYIHDLIGLKVLGENDEYIGVISNVISLVSNDVYEIELLNKKKMYYPAVKEFIKEIDINNKIIRIKNYENYFDTNDAI